MTVTGGKKYIGCIPNVEKSAVEAAFDEQDTLVIDPAFEFIVAELPAQGPQGQIGFRRIVRAAPVDGCQNPARVRVLAEGLHFLDDMQEADKIAHKKMMEELLKQLMQQRLASANIVVPNMQMPNGPIRSS